MKAWTERLEIILLEEWRYSRMFQEHPSYKLTRRQRNEVKCATWVMVCVDPAAIIVLLNDLLLFIGIFYLLAPFVTWNCNDNLKIKLSYMPLHLTKFVVQNWKISNWIPRPSQPDWPMIINFFKMNTYEISIASNLTSLHMSFSPHIKLLISVKNASKRGQYCFMHRVHRTDFLKRIIFNFMQYRFPFWT